ncbi:hypothetical protein VTJ04DRAFT_9154 [Mycothermus thermophilus]|uniref:uncharacterized protein n=1 Tax=Humicola insolens TaxID=85995 RepID=UPI0037427B87
MYPKHLLAALLGLGLSTTAQAAGVPTNLTYPQTVTVALAFPRHNETYTPSRMFPMIWAIHNIHASAPSVPMILEWEIKQLQGSAPVQEGSVHVDFFDREIISIYNDYFNQSITPDQQPDPFHFSTFTQRLNTTEYAGRWEFAWSVRAKRCREAKRSSATANNSDSSTLEWDSFTHWGVIEFNIADDNSAQDPMDFTLTQASTCSNWTSFAFQITDTLPIPKEEDNGLFLANTRTQCAVIPDATPGLDAWEDDYWNAKPTTATATTTVTSSPTTVMATPCLATMDETAAASVSKHLTSLGCGQIHPSWVPVLDEEVCKVNAGARGVSGLNGSVVGVVAIVVAWVVGGGLLFGGL